MEIFKGKRIAIVGAAGSALNTGLGEYIDGFDIVVRINKASLLIQSGKHLVDIGTKTDVLFHSFYENDFSGGGPLDVELFEKLGVRYLVNPIPTYFGWRQSFNFYKKYLLRYTTYTLPWGLYNSVIASFRKYRPTTGFCALLAVINSDFKELYITGFTFFRTAYADGYRDALKDVDTNKKYIKDSKQHDPDTEFQIIVNLINKSSTKRIMLDQTLTKLIAEGSDLT